MAGAALADALSVEGFVAKAGLDARNTGAIHLMIGPRDRRKPPAPYRQARLSPVKPAGEPNNAMRIWANARSITVSSQQQAI
jgi:hypothetical protein